jgi:hypothetical protein
LKKIKKFWKSYREKISSRFISSSYEKKFSQDQDFDEFDRIIQNLGKYIRSANQNKYEDYSNMKLYDIGKISALE